MELENYFIQHCKDNDKDISQIYEAINLLMDRTKPAKVGFDTKQGEHWPIYIKFDVTIQQGAE